MTAAAILKNPKNCHISAIDAKFVIPHLHDTTGCQLGCTTGLTTGCIVYTNIPPVVKPVSGLTTGWMFVCIVYTDIQPVWQNRLYNPVWQPVEWTVAVHSTRLSNRVWQPCWTNRHCSFNRLPNRVVQPQPVWQPAVYDTAGCQTNRDWQPVECLYTRYNRLWSRVDNWFDNRFDNRLYRVNGASRWRILTLWTLPTPKISTFWKFKVAVAAILKNRKNGHISATAWPTAAKFGTVTQVVPLDSSHPLNSHILKIQNGGGGKIEKSSPCLSNGLTYHNEVWHGDAYWHTDLSYRQLKIRPFKI